MPYPFINEYACHIFLQNNIRRSRQLPTIDTIAQLVREKILPYNHLRLSILSCDGCHISASLFRSHHIGNLI